MSDVAFDLLAIERGAITAPAGCGKTQLIADALARHKGTKPILVLTHTNAGVAALRSRLSNAKVPDSRYRLATIDGFAMRLISTFPKRSGHDPTILTLIDPKTDYPSIRKAAIGLTEGRHLDDVLRATYARLFVDEYQDCSTAQHALALAIAQSLPTCVLGDPMQAIFNWNILVDWETDVHSQYGRSGELTTPWRWINAGEAAFGTWLLAVRRDLLAGKEIDLRRAPPNVTHVPLGGEEDHERRLHACRTKARTPDGCVLIMADSTKPKEQRRFARQTPGAVLAENVDLRDLVEFAEQLDLTADDLLDGVVAFASSVMTNVGGGDLLTRVATLRSNRARRAATSTEEAALALCANPSYPGISTLLAAISAD